MGINPTQPNFKSFTFDGENSRDYGVYITGEGVFNAPERNVEMVEIAGRNGAYVLDKGNFLNIEVTYPASIACDNETDFADAVSDLRNLLCSKVGYVRLEDDYNPNEYRLAIYKSGLEVDHDMLIGGEFDLVFECKPQRYLKSGETAISITSGDTITNPTRFDAKPLLESTGIGDIVINTDTITVNGNVPYGEMLVANGGLEIGVTTYSVTMQTAVASSGDLIYFGSRLGALMNDRWVLSDSSKSITSATKSTTGQAMESQLDVSTSGGNSVLSFHCDYDSEWVTPPTFNYGAASTVTTTFNLSIVTTDGTVTGKEVVTLAYDGASTLTMSFIRTLPSGFAVVGSSVGIYETYMNVTTLTTGKVYIDLDIGEAYKIENDEIITMNRFVQIPSELPVLKSGGNTVTFDNTITDLQIIPRWWSV